MRLIEEEDERRLFDRAADEIRRAIIECHPERPARSDTRCTLGVVGGRSMTALFSRLASGPPLSGKIDVFWLDERVSTGQKNADEVLPFLRTMRAAGSDLTWHPLLGADRASMREEADRAIAVLRGSPRGLQPDVIICSAGEDGHVASLFPRHDSLRETALDYVFELDSPKPPPERMTVTPAILASARRAFLFFTGAKHEAWELFSSAAVPPQDCPAKILEAVGDFTVFKSMSK